MANIHTRQRQAQILRVARKVHRITGIALFLFFIFIAVTGVLLGWKKHSGGLLLAKSYKGSSTNLKDWLPIDSLHTIACQTLHSAVSPDLSLDIERIDIRKDKGMVKFVFANHYWGIQLDGATGKTLQIERRRADFIEKIHDGSILDYYLGTTDGLFKLVYTSIMGIALFTFSITGFWLWYGPKRMRKEAASR